MGSAESFGVSAGDTVLVACSGGADSLALAVAARFVTLRMGVRCGLVTVDHGLQAGSDERAVRLAAWARERGFEPVDLRTVHVDRAGGPEAAARDARYAALEDAALEHGAAMVLLGHTRDDQAETVLLALARGSGPRGLAGMPERRERRGVAFVRPLLDVTRAETRAACEADGLPVWEDPHNTDPAYARSRVRPLVEALGAGVVGNLARTASLVGADSDYLDELAAEALEKALVSASTGRHATARGGPGGGAAVGDGSRRSDAPGKDTPGDNSPGDDASSGGASMSARTAGGVVGEAWSAGGDGDELAVAELARLAGPIRTRVLHAWALRLGAPGTALSRRHVVALEALVVNWHGQGAVALPGLLSVRRVGGVLLAERQEPNPED